VVIDPLYPFLIELEDGCCLGMGCRLLTHEYTATSFRAGRIRIGKGSVIGAYAMIRSGVSVGSKATVGAMSFVNRDVPDGETVAGVPAKPLNCSREDAP
jgi:acetyltransferase-like isoleucine patch superfamily enzyme